MNDFPIAKLPKIEFGDGKINLLPSLMTQYGNHVLLVTGSTFLTATEQWQNLIRALQQHSINWQQFVVAGEPSPTMVDGAVKQYRASNIELVVGIGGGSVLDAAKAIAGLLRVKHSVMDYLEGVGPELAYQGPSVPFIAVPTTAGTGSEATKNAVLSVLDKQHGFKKSFRHELLVADYALVDPELLSSCPTDLIAANGMDALTQLIESYVSIKANAFTDGLAWSGLKAVKAGLLPWYEMNADTRHAQAHMAYAALISGITLAQVGLGSVHGLASPMGAFFPIPHGVVCGTLLADATLINITAMQTREPNHVALKKYADIGRLLADNSQLDDEPAQQTLIDILQDWTQRMRVPLISEFAVQTSDLDHIVAHARGSSMKTNPIMLTDDEIKRILLARV
ncbi:Alcohol dehydrogenase [hydrothermal vent metagenome]|uniref:Alcohol dehydrogenase n=1 Tax=hydrothermal vent metagenome TaxID=652676 RepID=A0A3B0Z9N5_9ZZZZ